MSEEITKVPTIRFKGFTDPWEQRKVSEVATFLNGRAYKQPELLDSGKYPVLRVGNFGTNNQWYYSDLELDDKFYADNGDLLYTWATAFGPHVWNGGKVIYHYHIWKIELSEQLDRAYALQLFEADKTKLLANTNGSTMIHVTKGEMESKIVSVPPIEEQRLIGQFFNKLEEAITLQQRELDLMKKQKQTLLSKMFPKTGEQFPEIRFKGFTDPWEQRKLGDMADIIGGGTPSTGILEFWDGDIDWYAPAEIADQIYLSSSQRKITEQGYNHSSAKMLPVGTVLFTSRAGIGKTAILSRKGCTNQGFQSIVPHKDELDSYFIFTRSEELKRYGETVGAGSTFVEVSGKQMANMELMMPKTMLEQKIIGQYFSNLDRLITLQQRKLDQMKIMKKSLLKAMFV